MKALRILAAFLMLAALAVGCSDQKTPTVPDDPLISPSFSLEGNIGFDDFGPGSWIVDFDDLPTWTGLEGRKIGLVTFSTHNNDNGSFGVEVENSNFPAHSGTQLAIKSDGWNSEGGSNWPPPTIAATFSIPVVAAGAWVTSPS